MEKNSGTLFYTPEEFRGILRCSRSLCYEALRQKKIRSFRFGKKYFIPASELDRLREVANDDAGSTENESSILF